MGGRGWGGANAPSCHSNLVPVELSWDSVIDIIHPHKFYHF